jgi:hypothetical protein
LILTGNHCTFFQGRIQAGAGHRRLLFSIALSILAHFWRPQAQKTGLSAPIFWLRQKDFRFYPLCPTGFSGFGTTSMPKPRPYFAVVFRRIHIEIFDARFSTDYCHFVRVVGGFLPRETPLCGTRKRVHLAGSMARAHRKALREIR